MDKLKLPDTGTQLFGKIAELLNEARRRVVASVNQTIVVTYFEVGRLIVEDEQQGKKRAEYGKSVLKELSQKLTKEFGKGFSVYNLERMRNFYLTYRTRVVDYQKSATLLQEFGGVFNLSWSHYLLLIKIENKDERQFYEIEASSNNWSFRELEHW